MIKLHVARLNGGPVCIVPGGFAKRASSMLLRLAPVFAAIIDSGVRMDAEIDPDTGHVTLTTAISDDEPPAPRKS